MKPIKTSLNELYLYHYMTELSTIVRNKLSNELYHPLFVNIDRGISMIKRRELKKWNQLKKT
jgi:hypothetical protein